MTEPTRSQRQREPVPVLRRRVPSGRGAMEQPNVTGAGDAPLTGRFWLALCATGVAAGLAGAAMMLVLTLAEHLTYGYHEASVSALVSRSGGIDFQTAVERASALRRVVALLVAGAVGGVGWYALRRWSRGSSEVDEAIWRGGSARLAVGRSLGTSVVSEVAVGMGASLGREAAPKLLGGVAGSVLSDRFGLSDGQRRLVVACGAGAGLAAVYNVPLGGALFTAELLVGVVSLPVMLPALACAAIASAVAWLYLPDRATYVHLPNTHFSVSLLVFAVLVGLVLGVVSVGWVRLVGWVGHHRVRGVAAIASTVVGFGLLGVIGIAYPQLFGNGKDLAQMVFVGQGTIGLLLVLGLLKPVVTAGCLGVGGSGGLFTPTVSMGAALGGGLGLAFSHLWPGTPASACAVVGAAALIGAAMQAPLAALALVLELTHTTFDLLVPMAAATVIATAVGWVLDGYSIYSARLPATGVPPARALPASQQPAP
jgi:H+/Cl- antiporter ClcA